MLAIRCLSILILTALVAACGSDTGVVPPADSESAPTPSLEAPTPIAGTPVVGHANPLSLLESEDPTLAANKRLVFDMWRGIVNSGHVELADQMLTPGYIQHSPLLPTGREAFKSIFSAVPRRAQLRALVEPPLIALVAENNLVAMAFIETLQTPDRSETYTSTHFNLFRIDNGRLAEHWHSLQGPPGPEVLPPDRGGPQRVTGVTGIDQLRLLDARSKPLKDNKGLVFDLWRNVKDAGDTEAAARFIAADHIEHNPNVGSGLSAFTQYYAAAERQPVQDWIADPIVAIVAEGDLVVMAVMREHPHPHREGDTYTSTWFDMFRIADGRMVEHWDPAILPGSPVPFGGEP